LFAMRRWRNFPILFFAGTWLLLTPPSAQLRAQTSSEQVSSKRPITITDSVGMTRLEIPEARSSSIASFSPDGKRFVVILRQANLQQDRNDFSLLLYQTADVFVSPKADLLLKLSSSSFHPAISGVRWLADNETLAFIGENPDENAQVYAFNVRTRIVTKLTNHPTAVGNYDITPDGRVITFLAAPPELQHADPEKGSAKQIVIEGQRLADILEGRYSPFGGPEVFWQQPGHPARLAPVPAGFVTNPFTLSLSPDGRYVAFLANVRIIPHEWAEYQDQLMQQIIAAPTVKNSISTLYQYLLFDSVDMSVKPLVNAPMPLFTKAGADIWVHWDQSGKSLFLTSFLPLDVSDSHERAARQRDAFSFELKLPDKEYRKVGIEDFPANTAAKLPFVVKLEQNLNTPPKLYGYDEHTKREAVLLDLNPQFRALDFGAVKTVEWNVDGVEMLGGLYLPPNYDPGKRYPLVIQTHGFEPEEFSMDGRSGWSSAFAARPLAAKGIVVLQFGEYKNRADSDRVQNDRKLGATLEESARTFNTRALEGAIDYLDRQGVIDRNRVGISGFSRFVCFIGYFLTHSQYRVAAANLVDGWSCGYFGEIAFPETAWDTGNTNGGAQPFGEGLKLWMKNAPGFNLDKVQTPVLLTAFHNVSVLGLWEWYAGLSFQKKPVDFVMIPGGTHVGVKVSQGVLTQQDMVDWFSFWLKGEEDPDPAKAPQYVRWRELRKLQEQNQTKAPTN
jgi:dipeptidyl aminopeptidase/acylaminoacyl peptidase